MRTRDKSSSAYPCPHPGCERAFERPSHLLRHEDTHRPPSKRVRIPCPECDRVFQRQDVLLRHLRTAHGLQPQENNTGPKSCSRCVQKKLKCDRLKPCDRCDKSGSQCEYISPYKSRGLQRSGRDAGAENPQADPGTNVQQVGTQHGSDVGSPGLTPSSYEQMDEGAWVKVSTPSDSLPETSSASQHGEAHTWGQPSQVNHFGSIDEDSTVPSTIDISQPFDGSLLPDMGNSIPADGFPINQSCFTSMQPNFHTGGLDWLSFDMDVASQGPQLDAMAQLNIPQSWAPNQAQRVPEEEVAVPFRVDDGIQFLPSQARMTQSIPILPSQAVQQSSLPWPFDHGQDSTPQRNRLPPLRDVLSGSWPSKRSAPTTLTEGFISILSESRLPDVESLQNGYSIQALGHLQRLVECYFVRFHDVQPILHKHTWDISSCPTVLLTAMACVGALLSDNKPDAEHSCALSEICSTMITWMGASDGTNYRDISYLNALCLHQIYSLGSGNRQLYQNADRSRGILIGGLRGIGLLSSGSSVGLDQSPESAPSSTSHDTLTHEWRSWIARESGRRAAWAAFEYDCSLCTLTSRRGIVDLSELPSLLPCADSIWNATSAQAWFALQSRLGTGSLSPSLFTILKLAIAGRNMPSFLGSWAKRLCAQVMGRLLWDLKQLEVVAMPEYCGLGSLISAHRESKTSLLKGLNSLVESLATPLSTSDLISYNISSLLCHYSHLYAANDVLDIIVYIVRNLISPAPEGHDGVDVARRRLKAAFASDPQTARRLCWHAAQIVVIANEYTVSAPCEIMRVFMGYIFILAYSAYGPHETASSGGGTRSVRLDLPDYQISHRRVVVKWIQAGGSASLGSVQDICDSGSISAISRDAQGMMQKLQCWGLATRFTKIFQVFEVKGF